MTRRALVLVALAAVVLAGCLGGPGTETTTEPTDGNETATVSSEQIPGVSEGSLANATALAAANEASLSETGGAVRVRQGSASGEASVQLVVGADLATYKLTSSRTAGTEAVDVEIWSNETTRVMRMESNGDYNYRTAERRDDRLAVLQSVEEFLAAGNFTVANESTGDGTVVLTADEFASATEDHGPLAADSSFTGRLVVGESGLIHNLSVAAADDRGAGSYNYELLRTGVDRAAKPDWFDDVPASATLQPQLRVDVENSSYLAVRNDGGDRVPSNTTISVTSNNTTATAVLDASLDAGDTQYVYVDATTGALRVTADRPAAETVDPVTSPISVGITTDDGASLYSGSMAWSSESVSAPASGGSSGSSGGSTSASSGSASGSGSSSSGSA
ncbi:hypothetical protein ACFR9U_11680 [Halorientalis brevis]|uniref:Uncharacterized protein n=1 Tax=Halorientalis brevis TaxID=1126241 RepID=A0ABD6CCH6_9EURY